MLPLIFVFGNTFAQTDTVALSYKLLFAVFHNNTDSVITLLKQGAKTDYRDDHGQTALFYAVQNNNLDMVKLLEYNGAKINIGNNERVTPLSIAAWNGFFDIAEYLCYKGADPDKADKYGAAPLHFAAYNADYFMCDMLLFYGADVNIKSFDKNTPLHLAAISGDTAIIKLLIRHLAVVDVENNEGCTALDLAAAYGHLSAVKAFLDDQKHLDSHSQNSAIRNAAAFGNDSIINFLIHKNDYSPFRKNNTENPYNIALAKGYKKTALLLKKHGFYSGILPFFSTLTLKTAGVFGKDDFFMEHKVGVRDVKYNLDISLSGGYRFKRKAVLWESSQDVFYQLYERRFYFGAGLRKSYTLEFTGDILSLFAGLDFQYHFGNYSGSKLNFDKRAFFMPEAGVSIFLSPVIIEISYSYRDYKLYGFSPHFFSAGIAYKIDLISTPKKYLPSWL